MVISFYQERHLFASHNTTPLPACSYHHSGNVNQKCPKNDSKLAGKFKHVSLSSRQTDNTVALAFMVSKNDGISLPPE